MAETASVYIIVFLLTLIACHPIDLLAEGRQIKSINEKEATAVKKDSHGKTEERSSINLHQDTAASKEEYFQPTQPTGHNITCAKDDIAGKKEISPPNISFGDSATVYQGDFRPKSPGNSPGVGHKHAEDVETQAPGDYNNLSAEQSFVGFPPDDRPTIPGHSPIIGHKHAEEEEDVESNVVQGDHSLSSAENSLTGFQNGSRPTAPRHSPGVFSNKKAQPKA